MNFENLLIERINHDCFKVKGSKVIYFDPYQIPKDLEPADIIFISHSHADHCSPEDIKKLLKPETLIVTVPDCQSKLTNLDYGELKLVEPNQSFEIGGVSVKTIPAYNINKFRSPKIPYHPKNNLWVGFIVSIDSKSVYFSGDTDNISELQSLNNINFALIPVSGTYVMTVDEAVEAVKIIKPNIAIPMHYGAIVGTDDDAKSFKEKLVGICRVEIL